MKVPAEQSLIVQELLRKGLIEGHNWMAYRAEVDELKAANIMCFKRETEAQGFRYQMQPVFRFDIMPLAPVFQTLSHYLYVNARADEATRLLAMDVTLDMPLIFHLNSDDTRLQQQVEKMMEEVAPFGFTDETNLEFDLRFESQFGEAAFVVKDYQAHGQGQMTYALHFEKQGLDYGFTEYDAVLRRPFDIPFAVAGDIRSDDLDERMARVNWRTAFVDPPWTQQVITDHVLADLATLSVSGEAGLAAANLLKYKHWSGTHNEEYIPGLPQLHERYTSQLHFAVGPDRILTASQAHDILAGRLPLLDTANGFQHYLFNEKNMSIMANEKTNLEYLVDNLKYLGFGEKPELNQQLQQHLNDRTKEFTLHTNGTFKGTDKTIDATLHFRRSDQSGTVFFNKYDATLAKAGDPSKDKTQTFYINKGNGVTLKEAFNLLEGRSVNKDLTSQEGKSYNAWLRLNFDEKDNHGNNKVQQFTDGYGYDIRKLVGQYPLELKYDDSFANIVKSLEKGNRTPVTFVFDGKKQDGFIEANPKFKSVILSEDLRNFIKETKSVGQEIAEGKGSSKEEAKSEEKKTGRKNKPGGEEKAEPERERTAGRKR